MLIAVRQDFSGELSGAALLIFPDSKSLDLVQAVSGADLTREEIFALEHEALSEVGNIILNACLGTIANALQKSFRMSLPDIVKGDAEQLLASIPQIKEPGAVLFLHVRFSAHQLNIDGFIAVIVELDSLEQAGLGREDWA